MPRSKGTRNDNKHDFRKSSGRGKMNEFFALQLNAKRLNLPSFVYNGKTYRRKTMNKKPFLPYYTSE